MSYIILGFACLFGAPLSIRFVTTWNIHNSEGTYIGQASAHNAETAFREYMTLVSGRVTISPQDISAKEIEPSVCEITFEGELYVVRAIPQN